MTKTHAEDIFNRRIRNYKLIPGAVVGHRRFSNRRAAERITAGGLEAPRYSRLEASATVEATRARADLFFEQAVPPGGFG